MARAPHGALAPGAVSTLEFAERWSELARARCVHVRGALAPAECAAMVERVMAAEADWTHDFGGDQFSLVLPKGSKLTEGVSAAVDALKADGTLASIEKQWLSDSIKVPVLQ